MESIKITILQNFALISKIMPYFGYTHKWFILLSRLSSNTRDKLYEFYNEFK